MIGDELLPDWAMPLSRRAKNVLIYAVRGDIFWFEDEPELPDLKPETIRAYGLVKFMRLPRVGPVVAAEIGRAMGGW